MASHDRSQSILFPVSSTVETRDTGVQHVCPHQVSYWPGKQRNTTDGSHRAIHHAQAFLRMFVRIWKDQSLKSYSWLYSLNNQLKKSLSRLLAEVLENPNTEESLTSLELIDVTLRLYETSILVAGKTWAPLMQMRRKALERSGLDPHVFHSSQSGLTSGCLCGLVINLDTPVRPEDAIHGVGERDSILLDRQNSYPFGSAQVLTPSLDTTVVDPTSFLPVPFTWYDWDTVGVPSTQLDI